MASWAIAGFALLLAIGIGGAISGAWDTLLLWVNRVPFSTTGTVTDPVFGKDISFFLFELPFFRLVQSLLTGILLASLAVVGARYLVAATRGGEVFITRVRVHLAVIAGLYLLCVAFGYQLDKYELVYSQAGVATGVSFTDANARFMAYDVLTFLSGIAGALLIAAAFTRWIWPLGVVVGVWLSASVVLGGLYPEAIQRFTVDPNTYAQEEQYIANNIAMTRLAFGLDAWEARNYSGNQPLTEAAIRNEADTFTNARLWDYRPLQTTLDQLQTVRQYYDFWDVDTDRYTVNGKLRQVMLSGRELAIEKNPSATSWVNERVIYTHGIGVAMVPVNEVTKEGQPQLWIRDLPPVSSSGAPDDHPAPDLLRRVRQPLRRGPGRARPSSTTRAAPARAAATRRPAGPGRPASRSIPRSTGCCTRSGSRTWTCSSRTRSAPTASCCSTAPCPSGWAGSRRSCATTRTRTSSSTTPAISSTSRTPTRSATGSPTPTGFDTGTLGPASGLAGADLNYIRNSVKITMNAYDGTHERSTSRTRPIRSSGPGRASSRPCSSRWPTCRPGSCLTCASPRSCSTSRRGCTGSTTSRSR